MNARFSEEYFRGQWKKAGIDQVSIDKIAGLLKHRHYIHMLPDSESKGWSRWGGVPSLATTDIQEDQRFLCQIALDELPEGPARERLPKSGFLYFFIHQRGRDKGCVLYRSEAPSIDLSSQSETTTPITFAARMEYIIPEYETDEFDALDLEAEPGNIYMDWEEEFAENPKTQFKEGSTLLTGWSDGSLSAGRFFTKQRDANWDLLMTLNPKENNAVKKSSIGSIPFLSQRLYYFIKDEDLRNGDFSATACRFGQS